MGKRFQVGRGTSETTRTGPWQNLADGRCWEAPHQGQVRRCMGDESTAATGHHRLLAPVDS